MSGATGLGHSVKIQKRIRNTKPIQWGAADGEEALPCCGICEEESKGMTDENPFLEPLLTRSTQKDAGKVVIGTVKGDLHDIGKNLVVMMMAGAGYDVIDLGSEICRGD